MSRLVTLILTDWEGSLLPQRYPRSQCAPLRGFSESTQEAYLLAMVGLVRHYRRSPDLLSRGEIHAYLLL